MLLAVFGTISCLCQAKGYCGVSGGDFGGVVGRWSEDSGSHVTLTTLLKYVGFYSRAKIIYYESSLI